MVPAFLALPRVQRALLALVAVAVLLANVRQPFPDIAPLQHIPTVLLLLVAPLLLTRWPLSSRSLGLLTLFWLLHTLGGRYTYSNVPYDDWARSLFGHDISTSFDLARNGYDRIVHLAFGLLWTPPIAELLRRHHGCGRRTSGWFALAIIGAASALYEVFEWLLTMVLAPGLAAEYNGQQGDMWDAQKDMAIAMLGTGVAMAAGIRRRRATAVS